MIGETLDENILNKNSFCIINGAFLRRQAICPKNMNIHEYKFLLASYKALFSSLMKDMTQSMNETRLANDLKGKVNTDPVKFKNEILVPCTA